MEYELRELNAADLGTVCKIITGIGVRQFKSCFKLSDFKDIKKNDNIEQIGFDVFFDLVGIVMSNFEKVEEDIQKFLASLTGTKLADIKKLSLADYGELIIQVVTKKEFKDFFSRVMKLLGH